MTISDCPGPSAYDDDGDVAFEEMFAGYESQIRFHAQKYVPRPSDSKQLHMDIDDLLQEVRIKLWRASRKTSIEHPGSYIRQVVYHESVTMARQLEPLQSLPIDNDSEVDLGRAMVALDAEFGNPEDIVVQKESLLEQVNTILPLVARLSKRQRLAMFCAMQEWAEDVPEIKPVLERHGIGAEIHWPRDAVRKQRLQASLPHARRKLERFLEREREQKGQNLP